MRADMKMLQADACREVILAWSTLTELVGFAELRHGFYSGNGGFGVAYPQDLDEYQREVEGTHIPEGFVLVSGYGEVEDGYELLMPETTYLGVLKVVLAEAGYQGEASKVRALLKAAGSND